MYISVELRRSAETITPPSPSVTLYKRAALKYATDYLTTGTSEQRARGGSSPPRQFDWQVEKAVGTLKLLDKIVLAKQCFIKWLP